MSQPIVFDLNVNADAALIAFDDSIRAMGASKRAAEELAATLGGTEKVAEEMGVSVAQAAKLIEQAVKRTAAEQAKAYRETVKEAEKAAKAQQAAAEKAARETARAQEKAAKEARKAAEAAGNSWNQVAKRMQSNQVISDIEQMAGMFIMAGGAVSKFAMLVASLARPLAMVSTMLGPAAPLVIGLAAIPALAYAAVAALRGMADGAAEARKELEELGQRVDSRQARQLDEYAQSTERLQIAMDKLYVAVGAPIAGQLGDIALMIARVAEEAEPAARLLGAYVDAQAPLQEAWAASKRAGQENAETMALVQRTTAASLAAGAKAAAENKKLIEEERDLKRKLFDEQLERDKQREKELAREAEQQRRTQEQLDDVFRDSTADLLTEEGKIFAARDERIRQLQSLKVSEQDIADATVALEQQANRQIAKLYEERYQDARKKRVDALKQEQFDAVQFQLETQAIIKKNEQELLEWQKEQDEKAKDDLKEKVDATKIAIEQIAEAWAGMFSDLAALNLRAKEEDLALTQERLDKKKEALEEELDKFREYSEGLSAARAEQYRLDTKGARDALREDIEALEEREAARKAAVRKAFNLQQAASVGQVIISGATAFAGLLASLAPLGLGAPIAATAIVGPAVSASLAQIAAQKPPAHSGMTFGADEFYVGDQMVRQGEGGAIFNQRAMESGAQQRAKAENEGRPALGGGAAPAQLVLADAGRTFATAVVRDARRPGSPFATSFGTAKTGRTDPYRRGK